MSDFPPLPNIPKWRIAFWGVLVIGAFAWVAYSLGDPGIMGAGLICVPLVIALMLAIFRFGRSQWAKRNLTLLIWIYVISQSVLLLWQVLERR